MKIKGPNNGSPPVDQVGGVDEVAPLTETEGAPEVSGVSAPQAATGAGSLDPVAQVAAQLRAGEITVDQAVDRLIEDAIARQLSHQARDLEPKLRELLRSYAESDPFLAARIRRLTLAK
jgi:hypothetical protein